MPTRGAGFAHKQSAVIIPKVWVSWQTKLFEAAGQRNLCQKLRTAAIWKAFDMQVYISCAAANFVVIFSNWMAQVLNTSPKLFYIVHRNTDWERRGFYSRKVLVFENLRVHQACQDIPESSLPCLRESTIGSVYCARWIQTTPSFIKIHFNIIIHPSSEW